MPARSPTSRYRYDRASGRYRNANTGRYVSGAEIRGAIDRALVNAATRARAASDAFRERRLDLRGWHAAMRGVVKDVQTYSAAAAKGGWGEMAPADWGRVGRVTFDQYKLLERFVRQLEAGMPLDGRFLRRAMMYADAGRAAYHLTERAEMERRGFDEEANILGPADHCDGCLGETARGFVPIGELVPVGARTCLTNCHCRVRYRNRATGKIAA